jgi:hypothetical protein
MSTNPDFHFLLGRAIRLRGWGVQGLVALALVLSVVIATAWRAPARPALHWVISHLTSAPKNAS